MNPTVTVALDYLRTKYSPDLVLLYGSFATDSQTEVSDIDVIAFAGVSESLHDSAAIGDFVLDAWIHPLGKRDVEPLAHILPCVILWDPQNRAADFIRKIEEHRAANTKTLAAGERTQLVVWVDKMFKRAAQDSAEANYRYHWLVNDFPELYCKFSAQYYDGPVKTIRGMKQVAPVLHDLYETVLANGKQLIVLRQLYDRILT